ncbi:MAG: hypothetical protein H8E31_01940 [Planctomycetes bacterium]|nr:hypothetical protein [Planctomycetota bacterium]
MDRFLSLLTIFALVLPACGSTTAAYDPSSGGIRTVDSISYLDFEEAAGILVQSLLQSGTLDLNSLSHTPDGKTVLALESIDNYTPSTQLKSKVLTDKFRIALNKTGKVLTTTAVRFGGAEVEDSSTREARGLKESEMFEERDYGKAILPDVSLSGSIITMSAEEGRTKESVAIFKLTLTDLRTGLALWEDEAPIGKRRTRGLIGG